MLDEFRNGVIKTTGKALNVILEDSDKNGGGAVLQYEASVLASLAKAIDPGLNVVCDKEFQEAYSLIAR